MMAARKDSQFQNTDSMKSFNITKLIMIVNELVESNQWCESNPLDVTGP